MSVRIGVAGVVAVLLWVVVGAVSRAGGVAAEDEMASDEPVRGLRTLEAPRIELRQPELPSSSTLAAVQAGVPSHVSGEIAAGNTLTGLLIEHGIEAGSVRSAVGALGDVFDFRRSQPGHSYDADVDASGRLTWIRYRSSAEVMFEAQLNDDGVFEASQVEVELSVEEHGVWGTVESSLIAAFAAQGESAALAQAVVNIFQWDVDFSSDVRAGDAFRVVYEKVFLDGRFLRYGRVLAAEYRGRRVSAKAFHFESSEGSEGYYMADGRSVERMFLAAPCHYRRISSRFDPSRMHPVLRVRRPHLGVDYAASTGTPVVAVADGTVTFAARRGGNGNLVSIRHTQGYETGYAHLHRFARGIRSGVQVSQGQVIGYVGSTGLSTGPHLHFALKRNRQFIDPLGEHELRQPGLTGRALRDFERRRSQLEAELERLPIPSVQTANEVDVEESGEMMDFVDGEFANGEF
jgi:murein DD-endopeptidase MepM/ murein hydrolase activator NlpD